MAPQRSDRRPGGRSVEVARRPVLGRGLPRAEVAEIQRSWLLSAAAGAIDELGYTRTTIGHITGRSRISRRTFYDLFANREECLAAVLDDMVRLVGVDLAAAGLDGLGWRERVRTGLWTILSFLEREPVLARVCVVQALQAGPLVLERREAILAQLAGVVDEGRLEGACGRECSPLTAEGLVGAAFAIVHARLYRGDEDLTGLLGELMGLIVLPYLGPVVARREHTRRMPPRRLAGGVPSGAARDPRGDPFEGVRMRLTYRTARVLEWVAGHPGASNRMVADAVGIHDPGQISKLLRRLQRLGLLTNTGEGHAAGEPNAWTLSGKGERVAQSIRVHHRDESEAA
jgi:AcrR family transcriptional regulator